MTLKKTLIVLALLVVVGGAGVYALRLMLRSSGGSSTAGVHGGGPVVRLVKDPQPAPAFEVTDLTGDTISPAQMKGKVVLLNFWATWCPPCREEIPELKQLQTKYQGQVQVIGVSEDDDPPAKVLAFAKDKGMNYPIIMATPELMKAYGGVPALPTTFVVDPRGRVVQKHQGLYAREDYDRDLAVLLDRPSDARVETFADEGQVFLQNADKATALPGVDFAGLTDAQKKEALHRMNADSCTCGCGETVAACRLTDEACPTSLKIGQQIVSEVRSGAPDSHADKSAAPADKPGAPVSAIPAKSAPRS